MGAFNNHGVGSSKQKTTLRNKIMVKDWLYKNHTFIRQKVRKTGENTGNTGLMPSLRC